MLVHPLRSLPELRLVPPPETGAAPEPKVAVLLNANARKVTERVVRSLSHVVPEEDLFVSRSAADCRRIATQVVERRYDTVFTGGGDGTFVGFVNEIHRQVAQRSQYFPQRAPRFGVLKLGTGNGLANLVNASSPRGEGFLDDVLRARASEVPGYRTVDLLEVDGKLSPFSGMGVDGKLLNDYIWVKENLGRGAMKRMLTGPGGYFSAVAFRTVPHYLTHSTMVECEVFNGEDAPAYRLGADGATVEEIAPGGLILRGKIMMCAAGTIPFYGYALRMFPFAGQRRGFMNLRLGAVGAVETLANLHNLWRGRWFPEGRVFDVHAKSFTAKFARPMPFQVGGDAEGYRETLSMRVADEPVQLVDFHGAVN